MNIGLFNAHSFNSTEHWYQLEYDELMRQEHGVRAFSLRGKQPSREDVEWMDFAVYHFAQVADAYKRIGVPFCIMPSAHDIFFDDGETLLKSESHKNCKFITYQSFYHKKKFEEWGVKKPVVHVPHCVRTNLFKRKSQILGNKIIAGGRLIDRKGLHQLSKVDNLYIFGDGPLKSDLMHQLPMAKFTGMLDGEQLRQLMEESWLLLVPSMSEGLTNTIKEAMLMELQVVSSSVGGNVEFENITLLNDWSKINDVIKCIPHEVNKKGRKEILNGFNPERCVNMLIHAIEAYGSI